MRRTAGLLLAAVALCACGSSATSLPAELPLPPHQQGPLPMGAAVDPSRDDVSGAGQRLTLAQVLQFADANAPALIVAREKNKLAAAGIEGAEVVVPYNPEVTVGLGARNSGGVSRFEFEAALEQRIEIAGERGTRIEAATRARDAQHAELEVARWEVHALVHALYYKLLLREKQLALATKLETFTTAVGAIIDRRVAAGEDSPLQTIVAKAELARANQVVIAAKQEHLATSLRLAELAGFPASQPIQPVGTLAPPVEVGDAAALVDAAIQRHPAKRWLTLEMHAAEARVEREDRHAWPAPSLGVSYGREAEAGGATHLWLGQLSVPIPLWERNQAARAQARAELGVKRAEQASFEKTLRIRVAAGVAGVNAAAQRAALYGTNILPAFEGNLNKLQRAFELGEIDVLELAQIQQTILLAQSNALSAHEDYYAALAALRALAGVHAQTTDGAEP